MIQDQYTNYLYLADVLPQKYPDFFNRLSALLNDAGIKFSLLPHTKDIWAVDYMPIQISSDKFVQFIYDPDYLQSKELLKTISDVDLICDQIGITTRKFDIKLDGGNVIKEKNCAVLCDKVFKENRHISKSDLEGKLKQALQIERIIFIPTDPLDKIGHADGMVRFINDTTVIINDYATEDKALGDKLKNILTNAGLNFIEIPYNPYHNKKDIQANGIYINYLQMKNIIILPVFNIKEDEVTVKQFEKIFDGQTIQTIESNEIAAQGGVLNCISWNIKAGKK